MHVVDFPLLPDPEASATQSIDTVVSKNPELSSMAKLIAAAGVKKNLDVSMFAGTLFAPTNKVRCFGRPVGCCFRAARLALGRNPAARAPPCAVRTHPTPPQTDPPLGL